VEEAKEEREQARRAEDGGKAARRSAAGRLRRQGGAYPSACELRMGGTRGLRRGGAPSPPGWRFFCDTVSVWDFSGGKRKHQAVSVKQVRCRAAPATGQRLPGLGAHPLRLSLSAEFHGKGEKEARERERRT
jgi:hypothetical protein